MRIKMRVGVAIPTTCCPPPGACHAPVPAEDTRSDFGVACPKATIRDLGKVENSTKMKCASLAIFWEFQVTRHQFCGNLIVGLFSDYKVMQ